MLHGSLFLKKVQLKPHKIRDRLHFSIKQAPPELFAEKANEICGPSLDAIASYEDGIHFISADGMPGIQALEHNYLALCSPELMP